jgi:hypothetical protein
MASSSVWSFQEKKSDNMMFSDNMLSENKMLSVDNVYVIR